ncbi:MAG: GntR family transcriptional regulator [Armatimonadota bacterium]|nr:GntR family transcriptional regulator [Armatimonadota bacterium]
MPRSHAAVLLADRIFDDLKGRIVRFDLRPGERLLEEDLARQWHASRTPIREACKRLVQAGLIRAVPRRGYYVREINLPEVEELYEVRVALEAFAVTLATERGRGADWEALARRWARVPDPLPSPDTMLELDEGFHLAVAEAGGNRALLEYLRMVNERIRAVRAKDFTNPDRIRTTYAQHAGIVRLIATGDAAGASGAMQAHILESKANVVNAVKELLAAVYLRERGDGGCRM